MANAPGKVKRDSIRVPLTAALVHSLDFHHWPVSPVTWAGNTLVTEPTPPHIKDWVIRDTKTAGFGLRVTKGAKSYFVQRKRKGSTSDRWVLTDQHSFQAARAQAQQWYATMARVEDPRQILKDRAQAVVASRAAKNLTFERVFDQFVADGARRVTEFTLKPGSLADRKAVHNWMGKGKLWETPLLEVTEDLVAQTFGPLFGQAVEARRRHRLVGGPKKRGAGPAGDVAAAHKCLTYCSAAWNHTKGAKVPSNPFSDWRKRQGKKLPKVERRTAMLSPQTEQGTAWLRALEARRSSGDPFMSVLADYVLIGVLWAGRKTEMALVRWMDVDFDEQCVCFAAETTKANKDHYVPLTRWAAEILKERKKKSQAQGWPSRPADLVFPYPTGKDGRIDDYRPLTRALKEETGLWIRLHDLRRTLAGSIFGSVQNLGTVAIALGHTTGHDVALGYLQRQVALTTLRTLYQNRENELRQLMGLDLPPPSSANLPDQQRAMLELMRTMMKQTGLDSLPIEEVTQLLANS